MEENQTCGRLTLNGHLAPTCACYEAGWALGKDKVWFELTAWVPGQHGPECECTPCVFAKRILDISAPALKIGCIPVNES